MHKAFSQISSGCKASFKMKVVVAAICLPKLGTCCRFGFLPPHHGGANHIEVLKDPNGVQVRQPKESRAK
jgi:hypothetical protein